jgi:hypothetical protein
VWLVLSNHYHLVLHIDQKRAEELSEAEVMERWSMVVTSPLPVLLCRYARGETTSKAEDDEAREIIATLRERLYSLSWFMRRLNEVIAKEANKEDGCKGHLVSRPREFHPQPLAEPDVTLSRHPAPIIEPILVQNVASQRTGGDSPTRHASATQNWL